MRFYYGHRLNIIETATVFESHALRTLMESAPDLIFFKNLELRFVLFSRSTAENARLSMLNAHRAAHPHTWRYTIPKHLATAEPATIFTVLLPGLPQNRIDRNLP